MIRSKSALLPRSHPQTYEFPGNPVAFPRSAETPGSLAPTSLHPSVTTPPLDTPDLPQPQSPQWFAHSFRYIGGVPLLCSIFEFPILTIALSKLSVSRLFAILIRKIMLNFFVCHSYKKRPGVGYSCGSRIYVPPPHLSRETFPSVRRTVAREPSAAKPCLSLPRPGVPRGAA